VSNDPDRFSGAERDLICGKTLVVNKLNGLSLPGLEMTQHLLDQHACLSRRISCGTLRTRRRQKFVEWSSVKESARDETSTTVQNPLITEHQEPGLEFSLVRIKLVDRPKDIEEYLLDCIFGFCSIAQDAPCDGEKQRTMPLKEHGQSIGSAILQMLYQRFVG
jgi:hypothetical protein